MGENEQHIAWETDMKLVCTHEWNKITKIPVIEKGILQLSYV